MDKTIFCVECQQTFVVTAHTQYIYFCKQYPLPKRCPKCIEERKQKRRKDAEYERRQLCERARMKGDC